MNPSPTLRRRAALGKSRAEFVSSRLVSLLRHPAMHIAHARFSSQLSSAPQPIDGPRGYGRGHDPDRVLLLSSQESAGSGVISHQLALVGQLADEVSHATHRGADVELAVYKRRRIRHASRSLEGRKLQKYDAVVIALGEADAFALTPPDRWTTEMEALLDRIRGGAVPGTPIVVTGIPKILPTAGPTSKLWERAQRHAKLLDHATERLCHRWHKTAFVPMLPAASTRASHTPAAYLENARRIARHLAHELPPPVLRSVSSSVTPRNIRSRPQCTARRRQALLDLGVKVEDPDERIDRIVKLARTYFRTAYASLLLYEGDTWGFKSRAGFRGNPDMTILALPSIDHGHPVLVGNPYATDNPSFHIGRAKMNFYAGYPVETPDGYRVGVLSVFDSAPRHAQTSDSVLLRDLTMMLQRELWSTNRGYSHK